MQKRYRGVTLVEVLLVLVIGAGILFFSFRQYEAFRVDADIRQLQANVDALFQGMARYYRANCFSHNYNVNITPVTATNSGTLNPIHSPAPSNPFPVAIETDLVNAGYLMAGSLLLNPIVDTTVGSGADEYRGYITQFNRSTTQQRVVCMGGTNATGTTPATGCTGGTRNTGIIIIWKPQIAVLIRDTAKAAEYMQVLNADCLSSLASATTVQPCSANRPGDYIVWERMPSFASTKNNSPFWESNPQLVGFTQLYTSYSINYLANTGGTSTPSGQQQYVLCGG